MQKLHHKPSKALEGTWDADSRADFDKDALGRMYVDLKFSSLIYRRIEQGK